jgi:Mg2+ and Co2+ transporter CorA
MRTLTIFSALFLPLGVVGSIWYYMPIDRGLPSLCALLGTMFFSSFVLFLFFRKKKWF